MKDGAILLVEDNADDVELTLRALTRQKISNDVTVMTDGQQALDYLFGAGEYVGRDTTKLPIVVLLDLNLPKVGGLEVLRSLRADARTKLLPVVILTSSKEERDLIEGYSLGANSYVRKPVDFIEFAEAVRILGVYWLLLNRPAPVPVPGELTGGAVQF